MPTSELFSFQQLEKYWYTLLLRHTFFLNKGYCHRFQREKGSIIIFFALHLASVLIDWTSQTIYLYLMCLPRQYLGQIFYLIEKHVENLTYQLLYILDTHSEIYEQILRRLSIAHLGNTCKHAHMHDTPSWMGWAEKAKALLGNNLSNKLCLQKDFILEMFH